MRHKNLITAIVGISSANYVHMPWGSCFAVPGCAFVAQPMSSLPGMLLLRSMVYNVTHT